MRWLQSVNRSDNNTSRGGDGRSGLEDVMGNNDKPLGMSGGVPAGWVLVPVEPTEAMVKAASVAIEKAEPDDLEPEDEGFFWGCSWMTSARDAWSAMLAAMLAATPTPPIEGRDADVEREARFLLDRLVDHEVRMTSEQDAREWYGHVTPSMARLRAALQALGERP